MSRFRRVFVATDFSPCSREALKEAVAIAKENESELVIAHVCQAASSMPMSGYLAPGAYYDLETSLRKDAEKKLQGLAAGARQEGINVRSLVLAGTPDEAIAEAAREAKADLLVVGTHGRTGASRFFLGSVATRVISTASCPVLTIRAA